MRPIDADAFKKYIDAQEGRPFIGCTVGEAMKILIDEQPTIQPVATDTNVGDTVSRQAALEKVRAMQTYKLFEGDDMILVDKAEVQTELMMLPPAQPEPHEGHWIWVAGDLECSKCHTRYPDLYPDYDNSVACPHCGARMKGATT